jgi:hypothetical protein
VCTDWREQKNKIFMLLQDMDHDEVILGLGPEEANFFKEKTDKYTEDMRNDAVAITLSTAEFSKMKLDIREAKDKAVEM